MNLAAILKSKGGSVLSIGPATRISEVIKFLAEKRIGAAIVSDADGQMTGIISERDIVRMLAVHALATFDMTADQVMTRSPKVSSPQTTVAEAMEMMTDGKFRHLPVVAAGKLVGVVSIGDVVKARLSQSEDEVESLRTYVSGGVT